MISTREHWTMMASAERCDEDRYDEQLGAMPPEYWEGDRFAVGEPINLGLGVWPVCFRIDGDPYWGRMTIRALKQLDERALRMIAEGSFVVRDGKDSGYIYRSGELVGRFYGYLANSDGVALAVESLDASWPVDNLKSILALKFDVAYWRHWEDGNWEGVNSSVDIV